MIFLAVWLYVCGALLSVFAFTDGLGDVLAAPVWTLLRALVWFVWVPLGAAGLLWEWSRRR